MTAEIGLLNKTSVVLAADSAATISLHKKVYNTANKLFPLSNYEPIGIMIYNNSNWMGIPFEIIIKSYTKYLNDKSFSSLTEYRDDFISFLKSSFKKFVNEEQIHEMIGYRLFDILDKISEISNEIFEEKITELEEKKEIFERNKVLEDTFFEVIDSYSKIKEDYLPEFVDYKFEEFKLEFKQIIDKILPGFYVTIKVPKKAKYTQRIYKALYHELVCKFTGDEDFSGIVIAGYGTDEIFPTICEIKIAEILSNKLRYEIIDAESINNEHSAFVCPFAQRDMVDTFFHGINPQILTELKDNMVVEFEKIIDEINKNHSAVTKEELRKYFQNCYSEIFENIENFSIKNYINPIVNSISYLRKEDLIEFAESLINITSIKRKTNSELQSVGGPIDIAVITKHEGFIWIKKKDNIVKDINTAYYNREFKK